MYSHSGVLEESQQQTNAIFPREILGYSCYGEGKVIKALNQNVTSFFNDANWVTQYYLVHIKRAKNVPKLDTCKLQ